MRNGKFILFLIALLIALLLFSCKFPKPEQKNKKLVVKNNYIILLDLSDRLIVQDNQPERDKQIIKKLYSLFEEKVKKELYIKSRDELKVVMAPQLGTALNRNLFEDRLYVNIGHLNPIERKAKEDERRIAFYANLDTLYREAVFSKNPQDYYGADIWKYFYEDLKVDYSSDSLTRNYLFILTDGYPIVGQQNKLLQVKNEFPNLQIVLLEAAPREKDLEWDHLMSLWETWFTTMGIEKYTLVKRSSISKELEQIKDAVSMTKVPASMSPGPRDMGFVKKVRPGRPL